MDSLINLFELKIYYFLIVYNQIKPINFKFLKKIYKFELIIFFLFFKKKKLLKVRVIFSRQ